MTNCPGQNCSQNICELIFIKNTRCATLLALCVSGTESSTSHSCLYNLPINKHLFNSHSVFSTNLGAGLSRDALNIIPIFQEHSLGMGVT